VIVAPAILAS